MFFKSPLCELHHENLKTISKRLQVRTRLILAQKSPKTGVNLSMYTEVVIGRKTLSSPSYG